ncbi:MAG: hypothetical protein WCG13_09660 [Burkholderiales bacterium]
MSDHTNDVAGARAHALAATSFHHRNPVAYPWAAVYQPSHLLRGLSRFDPTSPLRTSRAATQWVARIEWAPRQAVLRKFEDAASAQAWLELERSKMDVMGESYWTPTPEDFTPLELSNASKRKISWSLAKEACHG